MRGRAQQPNRSRTTRHSARNTLPRHGARIPKGPRRILDRPADNASIRPHRRKWPRRNLRFRTPRNERLRSLPLHRRPRQQTARLDPLVPTPQHRMRIRRRSARRTGCKTPHKKPTPDPTPPTSRRKGLERSPPTTQMRRRPQPHQITPVPLIPIQAIRARIHTPKTPLPSPKHCYPVFPIGKRNPLSSRTSLQ